MMFRMKTYPSFPFQKRKLFVSVAASTLTSTKMDFRTQDTRTALSIKSAVSIHLRKTLMTMRDRVPFASSSHVAHANDARTE